MYSVQELRFAEDTVNVRSKFGDITFEGTLEVRTYINSLFRWVQSLFDAGAVHMRFARVLLRCGALTLFCSLLYVTSNLVENLAYLYAILFLVTLAIWNFYIFWPHAHSTSKYSLH